MLRKQVGPAVAALAGDDGRVELRAALVASQILGLALCRYVLRVPPLAQQSAQELSGLVGPTLERYIFGALV